MDKFKHTDLTERIIKAFYAVYNRLGYGFLEKVHGNALLMELQKIGLSANQQCPINVYYDDKMVGEYIADIVVDDCIIIEIKAAKSLSIEHEAQLLNYLKATNIETGLLLNFGPKPEVKRKAFNNSRKQERTTVYAVLAVIML